MEEKPKFDKIDVHSAFNEGIEKEFFVILAELLFIISPFFISILLRIETFSIRQIFQLVDIPLMSSILFGQTIVKITMGVSAGGFKADYQRLGFILSLLIVIGLIPSVLLIVISYQSDNLSYSTIVLNVILFTLALLCFLLLGSIGQTLYSSLELIKKRQFMNNIVKYVEESKNRLTKPND